MSTFYGGEQLVSVKNLKGTSTSDQTLYTVPAGRFAEVFLYQHIKIVSGSFPADNFLKLGNPSAGTGNFISIESNYAATTESVNPIILIAGQTIETDINQSGPTIYFISIKEYLTP